MTKPISNRFSLRFNDPALEQGYRDAEDVKALRLMRIGLKVGVVVFFVACLLMLLMAKLAEPLLPSGLSHGMATPLVFLAMIIYRPFASDCTCLGL